MCEYLTHVASVSCTVYDLDLEGLNLSFLLGVKILILLLISSFAGNL